MKYYLIPITDNNIYYEYKSLNENLKENYQELYNKEITKAIILHKYKKIENMPPYIKSKYLKHLSEINLLYSTENIPKHIIAIGNLENLREAASGAKLLTDKKQYLKKRQISKVAALNYLKHNHNYNNEIDNFFRKNNYNKKR